MTLTLTGTAKDIAPNSQPSENPLQSSRQVILVTTKDWNAVPGTLFRFERRAASSKWREVGKSFPVVVGRNGLAWGTGLKDYRHLEGPKKKEGDGKSPAGIFHLSSAFGLAEPGQMKWVKLPYLQLLSPIECVDDAKSTRYNTIVDRNQIANPDWDSSEKMREIGEPYRLGVVVDHNVAPRENGAGSCIFLHIWKNAQTGTSGCTAMTPEKMKELMKWLDPRKNPVLVQLPEQEYKQRRTEWELPAME